MLINLTNHPSDKWSEKQIETAKSQFGQVEDLQFPNISPYSTEKEIETLAKDYCDKIVEILEDTHIKNEEDGVHLMGEQTFCYALLQHLCNTGIRCYASTTERKVVEVDGKKISEFNFVKFREYKK